MFIITVLILTVLRTQQKKSSVPWILYVFLFSPPLPWLWSFYLYPNTQKKTTLIISCMLHCVLLTFPLCHHFHSVLSKFLQSSYLHCCFHLCLLAICLLVLMAILWATDLQFLIKNQATSENQALSVSLFILFMFLLDLHHFFKAKASCHFKTSNVLWLWSKIEKSVIKWNGMVFSEEILMMN